MGTHPSPSALSTFNELIALRPDAAWPGPVLSQIAPESDPLRVPDLLREAFVLDVRCECVRMTVGVLLDLRPAINTGAGTAALVVARGVRRCLWEVGESQGPHGPLDTLYGAGWWIDGWKVTADPDRTDRFTLVVGCSTGVTLEVCAERFDYFVADVPGLPGIPDFGEGPDDVVRAGLPDWRKPCRPLQYSRRDQTRP